MTKQSLVLGLIVGGCLAAVACSSSDDIGPTATGGAGGSGGAQGGASGSHRGGSGGTANAGANAGGSSEAGTGAVASEAGANAGGEGGATPGASEAGASGEGGAPTIVVPPLPLDPNGVVVTSATPATFHHLLVTATDYATKGEVASIKLNPATIEDSTSYPDKNGDVVAVGSGGLGFVLQRSEDKVNQVVGSKIKTTFDITSAGTGAAVDITHKAYVPVYNYNFVSVLDLNAGTVAGRVDLAQFSDPNDSDGSVNTVAGMYDSVKKLAYFVLARVDLGSYDASFHLPCAATKSLVIAIDATNDTIVDLNGAAAGKGIDLYLANPASAQLSADGKTISVLDFGCYSAGSLNRQGVEQLHLDPLSHTVAYAPIDENPLADLLLLSGQQALIHSSAPDYSADYWNQVDLSTGVLGTALNNVPGGAITDGTNVFGVTIDYASMAAAVVRYDVATDAATTVIASPWAGKYSFASTSALVP